MLLFLARVALLLAGAFAVGAVTAHLTRPKRGSPVPAAPAAKDSVTSPARTSPKDDAPVLVGAVAGETGSDVGGSNLMAESPPDPSPAPASIDPTNSPLPVVAVSDDGDEAVSDDQENPRPEPLADDEANDGGPSPRPLRSNWSDSSGSPAELTMAGLESPRDGGPDNLTLISGIGPSIERLLFENGIFHFDQIAAWTEGDVQRIDALTGFEGRVEREDWIGQSRRFAAETGAA